MAGGLVMKTFFKAVSILLFGVLCFVGGVAHGFGKEGVAAWFVFGAICILLNGFAVVADIETNEILERHEKEFERLSKKSERNRRKIR